MQALFAKIISFFMAILAFLGLVKPETPTNVDPGTYQVNGKVVTFCFDSNPTTGYDWTAVLDGDCVELTRDEYKQDASAPGMAGVGGRQYYDFTAVKPGTVTVTFTYARSWGTTDSDITCVAVITVADDLTVTVEMTQQ
ncbi:MAG: protease inhibitor I42 family protein [Clostridia bacterium]|nr:protease inhibitor I42 family protein [Clostridia bacterium]